MAKLHNIQLSPAIVEHVLKRRGGHFHAYDQIKPESTALIVIDMQNLWLQSGMAGYSPYCVGIVPIVNKLSVSFRNAGSKIYWVKAM